MRLVHLLWLPAIAAALALFVWLSLPDTVHYRFGDETALTGDETRGEWLDGWYWSREVAALFAQRRLGPGADVRCRGRGSAVRSVIGNTRLYRRLTCPTSFANVPGTRFTAMVRVENRNLATVFCRGCPADPAQRGEVLSLADRFVQLTHRAIPYFDEHGGAAPGHVAQAERLRVVLMRWRDGNPDDPEYREFAETTAECVRLLVDVISAASDSLTATTTYNACIRRFGAEQERLESAFGPQLPRS